MYEEQQLTEAVIQNMKSAKPMSIKELDLTKIEGDGDFPCPNCGVKISPEDETENVYTIIEEKVRNDILEELIIQCNACSAQIRLTGFPALDMDVPNPE
jgi:predicted RNA-binding Zn-ribbon protein involved in translation (DUF1610 family)